MLKVAIAATSAATAAIKMPKAHAEAEREEMGRERAKLFLLSLLSRTWHSFIYLSFFFVFCILQNEPPFMRDFLLKVFMPQGRLDMGEKKPPNNVGNKVLHIAEHPESCQRPRMLPNLGTNVARRIFIIYVPRATLLHY